jgi:hypothetical protein
MVKSPRKSPRFHAGQPSFPVYGTSYSIRRRRRKAGHRASGELSKAWGETALLYAYPSSQRQREMEKFSRWKYTTRLAASKFGRTGLLPPNRKSAIFGATSTSVKSDQSGNRAVLWHSRKGMAAPATSWIALVRGHLTRYADRRARIGPKDMDCLVSPPAWSSADGLPHVLTHVA